MARIGCCSVIVSLVVMLVGCASYKERAYEIAFECEERNPPLKKWREDAVPDVEDNETRWNFREEEGRSRADGVSSSLIAFSGKKVTVECCDDDNIVIRDAGSGNVLAEHPSGFSHFLQCVACLDKRQQQFLLVVKGIGHITLGQRYMFLIRILIAFGSIEYQGGIGWLWTMEIV